MLKGIGTSVRSLLDWAENAAAVSVGRETSRPIGHDRYREVREKRHVRFSGKQRLRSEAVSTKFGEAIVAAYRRAGLPVQPHQPLRNRIIRGKQRFVPAVLRSNAIPNKVLVEMLNLSNPDDAELLASARTRQQLARALQVALFRHFGERPAGAAGTRAAR